MHYLFQMASTYGKFVGALMLLVGGMVLATSNGWYVLLYGVATIFVSAYGTKNRLVGFLSLANMTVVAIFLATLLVKLAQRS